LLWDEFNTQALSAGIHFGIIKNTNNDSQAWNMCSEKNAIVLVPSTFPVPIC
jgi:hypothetical protein